MLALDNLPTGQRQPSSHRQGADERAARSGLTLLDENLDAFAARAALARTAESTLYLQYYYWRNDLTGRLLLREIIAAADRGVRVRLLLDDFNTGGRDGGARSLTSHTNIEVRFFNPTRSRGSAWRRRLELLLNFVSATRRMHNKAWIADARAAIVGGRNIGDSYFDACRETNFSDLDILAVGPAADDAHAVFNRYWTSEASRVRRPRAYSAARLARMRRRLERGALAPEAAPYLAEAERFVAERRLEGGAGRVWTDKVRILADPPEKAAGRKTDEWISDAIFAQIGEARATLNIVSPYFVPGEEGVARLCGLVAAGATVKVLTNSLASTDVAAVHGGYAKYRAALIAGGVHLYELRPGARRSRFSPFGSSQASLHTKAYTLDGRAGFVGSYNFDPRSRSINTEMGLLFENEELAREIDDVFVREIAPDSAYAVALEGGRLVWRAGGAEWRGLEPDATWTRRAVAWAMRWLPFEAQM